VRRGGSLVVALVIATPAAAIAEPMECTEDYLRMALGNRGVLPNELLRACLRIDADEPDYGVTQYMISVHFRRIRKVGTAAVFLERASRTLPMSADARTLYLLAQFQIASGRIEQGLVAKDRFLSNSGGLSRRERMRRTRNLYSLLETVYELRAADAEDAEPLELARTTYLFYREARMHLDRALETDPVGLVEGKERPLIGPFGLPPILAPAVSSAPVPRDGRPPA